MSAKKCPTPCKGSGEAITNRKEKRMPTQSLTSDELSALIAEQLEYFGLDRLFSTLTMPTGIYVTIHVDARFSGARKVDGTTKDIYIIEATVDADATLRDGLLAAYTSLLATAPLAVTA